MSNVTLMREPEAMHTADAASALVASSAVGSGYQTLPGSLNYRPGVLTDERIFNLRAAPWIEIRRAEPSNYGAIGSWFGEVLAKPVASIWDTEKFREILSQPLGSPVELTVDEAKEIIRLAFGHRPDLPTSGELVRQVRELLGHSIFERLDRSNG